MDAYVATVDEALEQMPDLFKPVPMTSWFPDWASGEDVEPYEGESSAEYISPLLLEDVRNLDSISLLSIICSRSYKMQPRYYESVTGTGQNTRHSVRCEIFEYLSEQEGENLQNAKFLASLDILQQICESGDAPRFGIPGETASDFESLLEAVKSRNKKPIFHKETYVDYTGALLTFLSRKGIKDHPTYIFIPDGPAHATTFAAQCSIGMWTLTGSRTSKKKDAKNMVSKLMLDRLHEEFGDANDSEKSEDIQSVENE